MNQNLLIVCENNNYIIDYFRGCIKKNKKTFTEIIHKNMTACYILQHKVMLKIEKSSIAYKEKI
jgi:predicted Ser/Thr protein kinase